MRSSAAPRRHPGATLRRLAAVLLLAGLFAMHGLPMAGAATAATTGASMSMSMPATATSPTTAAHAAHGNPSTAAPVMTGCNGADHCTATLRAGDVAPHPALVGTCAVDDASSALRHVVTATVAARGPPPPDRQELCISRT